jgi:hypothetical protein
LLVGRKIEDEREAVRCLRAAERKGLSAGDWARAYGVDGRSLHAWKMNLARRGTPASRRRRKTRSKARPAAHALVELVPAVTDQRWRDRSVSWVSRRLGLVTDLPPAVQEQVRLSAIGAHAAMKYLVPLARANASAAQQRGAGLLRPRQVRETLRKVEIFDGPRLVATHTTSAVHCDVRR